MSALVLRLVKGTPLTFSELDNNQVYIDSRLGLWSSTVTYSENQMVSFLGNIYRSLVNSNTNNLPNSTPQWELYKPPHIHGFADIATATSSDVTLAANSNTLLPTQRAVKTYVDSMVAGANYTDEQAQDAAATALLAGNATGDFTWTYDDGAGRYTGVIKNNAVTGSKIADNAVGLSKLATQTGPIIIGRGTGLGNLTTLTLSSGLGIAGTALGLASQPAQTILGTQVLGSPIGLTLGNNLTIVDNELRTNVTSARLLGRFAAGTGQVQEIVIGTGLSLSGGILSATEGGGGGSGVIISDTAPVSPSPADLWWSSTDLSLRIFYNDGNTSQWVDASPVGTGGGSGVTISDTAPASPVAGDLWWSSTDLSLRIFYNDGNTSQWVDAYPVGSGYTFTNTARLYGRFTAGSGPGEEIAIGTGLTLSGGTLSADSGGGGTGSQPGILGYETTPTGLYRSSISCAVNSDPNQTLSTFVNTAFIGNDGLVPDTADNQVSSGLIAASATISSPINGFYISMLGTLSSRISGAESAVIVAANDAVVHNPAAGTSTGNWPMCSLVHGAKVAGSTSSRTFNFGVIDPFIGTYITSFDVNNSDQSGPDSSAIIESTLIGKHNGFSIARFLTNTGGNLHDLLKGSSTTMAPFYWNIYMTVIGVSETGDKAATWEVKALVKGTGVNTCSIIGSTVVQIFMTPSAFSGAVVPLLTTSAITDPYEVPSGTLSLRCTGESGSTTSFYAYVRIQKLIRTAV